MKSRITYLQEKYKIAKSNFKEGNEQISVSPYYWSIYENDRIKEASTPSQAVADNPKHIISAFVHHYTSYGQRRDARIICYQNLDDQYYSSIPLLNWSLCKIDAFAGTMIHGARFETNADYNQAFEFRFENGIKFQSMQMLWDFARELDSNCSTVKEAKLFFDYYLMKLELDNRNLTLSEYMRQLDDQKDLNSRYSDLLTKITELVNQR